jgi:16S rRNA (uracil1498-N3)-methyltransferase
MQKFIIPEIKELPSKVCITGQDAKHIFKVLRKKRGDNIAITDGKGKDYNSIILNTTPESIEIKIIEQFNSITESFIDITLASGMLKDKKMDFVIKHITQLGVQKWMPFFCERSIPSPNIIKMEKRKKKMGKYCKRVFKTV